MNNLLFNKRTTPGYISDLKENEIFVYGSNLEGNHRGGGCLDCL